MKYNITNILQIIMPPKKTNKSRKLGRLKTLEKSDDLTNADVDYGVESDAEPELEPDQNIEQEQDEQLPELTIADPTGSANSIDPTQPIKEKYEYKPLVHTEIVFLDPENRMTSEVMTKFEYTEILSHRAKQLENGGTCFTDVGELTDPLEMAKKELMDKRCPLDIIRALTDTVYERWHVNEMSYYFDY